MPVVPRASRRSPWGRPAFFVRHCRSLLCSLGPGRDCPCGYCPRLSLLWVQSTVAATSVGLKRRPGVPAVGLKRHPTHGTPRKTKKCCPRSSPVSSQGVASPPHPNSCGGELCGLQLFRDQGVPPQSRAGPGAPSISEANLATYTKKNLYMLSSVSVSRTLSESKSVEHRLAHTQNGNENFQHR